MGENSANLAKSLIEWYDDFFIVCTYMVEHKIFYNATVA
jgi:hypothetical protein